MRTTTARGVLAAAGAVIALGSVAACGGDEPTAADPATTSEPTPTSPTSPTPGSLPAFESEDYSFVLEQICFCPIAGPVRVTVEDGKVVSAVVIDGGHGIAKGSDAPKYLHKTINDVIDAGNDPKAAEVDVVWPAGQDWPRKVAIDQIKNAIDDEITYLIRQVEIAG